MVGDTREEDPQRPKTLLSILYAVDHIVVETHEVHPPQETARLTFTEMTEVRGLIFTDQIIPVVQMRYSWRHGEHDGLHLARNALIKQFALQYSLPEADVRVMYAVHTNDPLRIARHFKKTAIAVGDKEGCSVALRKGMGAYVREMAQYFGTPNIVLFELPMAFQVFKPHFFRGYGRFASGGYEDNLERFIKYDQTVNAPSLNQMFAGLEALKAQKEAAGDSDNLFKP